MAIEPHVAVFHLSLAPEEAADRLIQWCAGQGLAHQRINDTEVECRFGEKSASSISGLMLGSFSGQDKWPAKVHIRMVPVWEQAVPIPPAAPAADRPKFCFHCGSGLPEEGRFCPECGHPVPVEEATTETGPASVQPWTQAVVTVEHDLPKAMLMGQLAAGPFKKGYQQRLAQIAGQLRQVWP